MTGMSQAEDLGPSADLSALRQDSGRATGGGCRVQGGWGAVVLVDISNDCTLRLAASSSTSGDYSGTETSRSFPSPQPSPLFDIRAHAKSHLLTDQFRMQFQFFHPPCPGGVPRMQE